ncbi:ribose-phosphate pyrophosphokinase [Vibrio phage RYC]|nr:ribose-phosphate pyrophosphokinase [Vibrio phage RYC]
MNHINIIQQGFKIDWTKFSDGSETCKVDIPPFFTDNTVVDLQVKIVDATKDLVRIGLVKDALNRMEIDNVNLTLLYFPQARADRKFDAGMPLPVKVFADIINSYKFDRVTILDPHSDVTSALVENLRVIPQYIGLSHKMPQILRAFGHNDYTLCAPDLGATKKTEELVAAVGKKSYIQGIKVRDVTTGKIIRSEVVGVDNQKDVLIVDDIADGGASFKYLAKNLKDAGVERVALYVSHGIFSKGLEELRPEVDFIFVNNIVGEYINEQNIMDYNDASL